MKKLFDKFFAGADIFNNGLAKRATIVFGTMWAFYVFVLYGLTPLIWPQYMNTILYWSNFVQLISLPLLAVGTALLSRDSEKRAQQDHETIMAQFEEVKQLRASEQQQMQYLAQGIELLKAQQTGDQLEQSMQKEILELLKSFQSQKE